MDGEKDATQVVIEEEVLPKNCDRRTLRCCVKTRRVFLMHVQLSDGKKDPLLSVYSIV